jgi:DNA mismatch endonuclease (patch repair protein)
MAAVRSSGNRSTETRLRAALIQAEIKGWREQARDLLGVPDFVFDEERVAIFVDGCFWHGCSHCYRRPHSSSEYWDAKVQGNMARDKRVRAKLRRNGWSVIRVWEHELSEPKRAITRIERKLKEKRDESSNQTPA